MRRENRKHASTNNTKNILYIGGSILGVGIIAFAITFVLYGNRMEEQSNISSGKIAELIREAETETESASTGIGKTVEESKNEIENNIELETNIITTTNNNNVSETATNTIETNTTVNETTITTRSHIYKASGGRNI